MKTYILPLGNYQTNTYIVSGNGQSCAVIDPGFQPETILEAVKKLGLTIDAVLLTHGHFDHVGGVERLVAATGCALWMHKADYDKPADPLNRRYYPLANCDFAEVSFCAEGDKICAGGLTFTVLSTPGHTKGSVCFLCGDALFSGDTLFAGSCGRTDLPGGDWLEMEASLHRLSSLEGDKTVYPGHGGGSSLIYERKYNPYLR
ncbi:MAG: MBL fold metallo-hydrolase [Oscillospiraceae bacterium]|nr:MBL fold metallo-hydrolase [Oscillospiraceae bacterium]